MPRGTKSKGQKQKGTKRKPAPQVKKGKGK